MKLFLTKVNKVLLSRKRPEVKDLAWPLNSSIISDLRSGVQSQTQEILHLPWVSEIVFLQKPHKWTTELIIGK